MLETKFFDLITKMLTNFDIKSKILTLKNQI